MVILNGFWRDNQHWYQLDSLDQHAAAGQSSWTKEVKGLLLKCITDGWVKSSGVLLQRLKPSFSDQNFASSRLQQKNNCITRNKHESIEQTAIGHTSTAELKSSKKADSTVTSLAENSGKLKSEINLLELTFLI